MLTNMCNLHIQMRVAIPGTIDLPPCLFSLAYLCRQRCQVLLDTCPVSGPFFITVRNMMGKNLGLFSLTQQLRGGSSTAWADATEEHACRQVFSFAQVRCATEHTGCSHECIRPGRCMCMMLNVCSTAIAPTAYCSARNNKTCKLKLVHRCGICHLS
jgi:hypothetical protein